MDEQPLTSAQWAAARLVISRLRSEAAQEEFTFEELGVTWLDTDDLVCAVQEDGGMIRHGDMLHAAIVLLWSMIVERSEFEDAHPSLVVSQLALGLANAEPAP